MTTRDQRPTPLGLGYDPAQLSFRDVEAVPQLRVEQEAEGRDASQTAAVSFREPPVCGEYTYDDVEDAGPSWSVRIVQEAEHTPAAGRGRPSAPTRPYMNAPSTPSRPPGVTRPSTNGARMQPAPGAGDGARPAAPRPSGASRPLAARTVPDPAPSRPVFGAVPSAALDPLRRSTELSPRDADAAIAYANALEKLGEATASLEALDTCLRAGGDEMRLICARAFLLGGRLKYDLAEAELKRAAKLRADDPELHLQVGILACRRARWRDAVEPLAKAAAHRADDALGHFYLGEALNHVDRLAEALSAYERATVLDPANWRAFKGVGIVLDRLGRRADAAVAYRQMREVQGR